MSQRSSDRAAVGAVPGVERVHDALEVHESGERIPALQSVGTAVTWRPALTSWR